MGQTGKRIKHQTTFEERLSSTHEFSVTGVPFDETVRFIR
jgi:hypothetical protein